MKSLLCTLCVSFAAVHAVPAAEPEWKPLFKPNDLSGWINVNCAPDTWTIKDGVVACTGKPTGALRTERQYENFELELEWRHMQPGGNAGIFVWASPLAAPGVPFLRAIEVQVLDNGYDEKGKNEFYTTHGDVFPIHGATMTPMRPQTHKGDRCFPSEERSKSSPEWNHYRIVANNGSIRLSVNGKEVSGGDNCNWRKGYLGLESEGSPTEWRNIKIKELPGTGATPEQSAPIAAGWKRLDNGVNPRGWKADGIPRAPFLSRKNGNPVPSLSQGQARACCDGNLIARDPLPHESPTRGLPGFIAGKGTGFANIFIREVNRVLQPVPEGRTLTEPILHTL